MTLDPNKRNQQPAWVWFMVFALFAVGILAFAGVFH